MASSKRPVQPRLSINHGNATASDLMSMFTDFAFSAANTAGKVTQKTFNTAEGIVSTGIDAVGLKDKVEAAESLARKLASRGARDTAKAANKARRMASRAMDFDEGEDSMASLDYDVLLSAAGSVEKKISGYGSHSVLYSLPAGSALVWKARVRKLDIGFSVREVRENESSTSVPFIIEPMQRFGAGALIKGELTAADRPRTINLIFDNSHSALQGKTVLYWVLIGEKVSLADDQASAAMKKEMTAAEEGPPDYTAFTAY